MELPERYRSNAGVFTEAELIGLREKRVAVVGCGGLGGYVCNGLARFGVGSLVLIDGDRFTEGNLNRQLFASAKTLGKEKAPAAARILADINSEVKVDAHAAMLTAENAAALLAGCDLAVDCLDNIPSRLVLATACSELDIPLVHGAISGLYGQVACLYPGDRLFDYLYGAESAKKPLSLGNPVFTPQLVASIQSCEAIKILVGRGSSLRDVVLYINLGNCTFETVSFNRHP